MSEQKNEFEEAAGESRKSLAREFVEFLATSKKYWMIPLLVVLGLLALVVILGGTSAAPFIYTLF
jgi:hypothetical protein